MPAASWYEYPTGGKNPNADDATVTSPGHILIIKPSSFGDIVLSLPALAALHHGRHGAQFDWVVKPEWASLLENHSMIRKVIPFPRNWAEWRQTTRKLRQSRYDLIIDLQGLFRSGLLGMMAGGRTRAGFASAREGSRWAYTQRVPVPEEVTHAVDRYLYLVRCLGANTDGPISFPLPEWPDVESWVDGLWRNEGIQQGEVVCVIHPGARWPHKRWPIERYKKLSSRLMAEMGYRIVWVGAQRVVYDGGLECERVINLTGRTTLPQLAALIRRAALLVTNDSGPMHLAAAVGTPVVAIFGPTDPRKTGPYGSGHTVLKKDFDCSACSRKRCVRGSACIESISVEEVFHAIENGKHNPAPSIGVKY